MARNKWLSCSTSSYYCNGNALITPRFCGKRWQPRLARNSTGFERRPGDCWKIWPQHAGQLSSVRAAGSSDALWVNFFIWPYST